MNQSHIRSVFSVRLVIAFCACWCATSSVFAADNGCRTGASSLADAYILSNPLYALFFGSLEPYVTAHKEHFSADGDSIRCAAALSKAMMAGAIQAYDPQERIRRDELNARLGAMGISSGQQESSASGQLFGMSMTFSRLARVLPAAAQGNFGPLNTPTSELEQQFLFAAQMLQFLLQDPEMRAVLSTTEPLIREIALLDHQFVVRAAASLAK